MDCNQTKPAPLLLPPPVLLSCLPRTLTLVTWLLLRTSRELGCGLLPLTQTMHPSSS